MTQLNNDLPAVLRRRARELLGAGYNATFVKALEHAAENLEIHRRYLVEGEAFTLGAIMANRVLRNALLEARGLLRKVNGKHEPMIPKIDGVLAGTKEPGLGRHILMLEVVAGKKREDVEREVAVVLDAYFNKGETDNGAIITPAVTVTGTAAGAHGEAARGADRVPASRQSRDARQQAARRVP